MIVNINSIVKYVIQIKNRITKHVNVNVKMIIVGNLVAVFVGIVST